MNPIEESTIVALQQVSVLPSKKVKSLKLRPFDWITPQRTEIQLVYLYDTETDEEYYSVHVLMAVNSRKTVDYPIFLETSIGSSDAISAAHAGIVFALQLSPYIYQTIDIVGTDGELIDRLSAHDVIDDYEMLTGEDSPIRLTDNSCSNCSECPCNKESI